MIQINGDNFEIDLVSGEVRVRFYAPEEKASLQMKVKLPEEKTEEVGGVLDKLSTLLAGVDLMIQHAKDELGQKKKGIDN